MLLDYLMKKGDITPVTLLQISVQTLSGDAVDVTLDNNNNTVDCLKRSLEDKIGTPRYRQQVHMYAAGEETGLEAAHLAKF